MLIETALGMANVEAIAAVEPAARGDALRRRRLRRQLPGPHGEHRRAQPRLSGRPVALRAVPDDRRLPGLRTPRRSTARSATSRIPTGYRAPPGAAPRSASRASGRSTPARSRWPTRCSPRRRRRWSGPGEFCDALDAGRARGRGAAQLDGRMIDAASARMAQNVVDTADAIGGQRPRSGDRSRVRPAPPDRSTPGSTPTEPTVDIHEYQAKELLAGFGVAIPAWRRRVQPRAGGLPRLGDRRRHAGRSRRRSTPAPGARRAASSSAPAKTRSRQAAKALLGKRLVTHQTGPEGRVVHRLYVEAAVPIERELYLGLVLDRKSERIMVVASPQGGMEIEEIAQRVARLDPARGGGAGGRDDGVPGAGDRVRAGPRAGAGEPRGHHACSAPTARSAISTPPWWRSIHWW